MLGARVLVVGARVLVVLLVVLVVLVVLLVVLVVVLVVLVVLLVVLVVVLVVGGARVVEVVGGGGGSVVDDGGGTVDVSVVSTPGRLTWTRHVHVARPSGPSTAAVTRCVPRSVSCGVNVQLRRSLTGPPSSIH